MFYLFRISRVTFFFAFVFLTACQSNPVVPPPATYDIIIRGGTVYDGRGNSPFIADIGIRGDRIASLGDLRERRGQVDIDAHGLAVAPGFINMLSWGVTSLIDDGRALSDISQGVTLEVMGEGFSMGPLPEDDPSALLELVDPNQELDLNWSTLGEYLGYLEKRGVSPNVASFVGASTVRLYVMGQSSEPPSPQQLQEMQGLVEEAMKEGAMGVGAALVYIPGNFADTDELIALAETAAKYDGLFIAHIRSESDALLESIDEMIVIAREANVRTEIYHLKAGAQVNWHKLDIVLNRINSARTEGVPITANMYTYDASATALAAILPAWVREGGTAAMLERLNDPVQRQRVADELLAGDSETPGRLMAVGPKNVLMSSFATEALRPYTGMRLQEISDLRGTSPAETAVDLILEDQSRIGAIFFSMSEENLRKKVAQPWMSFCSDAEVTAPDTAKPGQSPHPREYGSFARLLAKYVRDEQVIDLPEAVRRLSGLPAENLKLKDRGLIRENYFADIVVFDPATVQDHATFEQPRQLATGVEHVFVNGQQVFANGEHTGALPGRFIRGPGWRDGSNR